MSLIDKLKGATRQHDAEAGPAGMIFEEGSFAHSTAGPDSRLGGL
ncbi:MAG: hypothetical protein RL722_2414, partial [Pseudomonadota bacterium]